MLKHLRNYWVIWLINLAIMGWMLFLYRDKLDMKHLAFFAGYELIFIAIFLTKTRREPQIVKCSVIEVDDRDIVVHGVFRTLKIDKNDVLKFQVQHNLLAKIFDWSKITVTMKTHTEIVYTRQIREFPGL